MALFIDVLLSGLERCNILRASRKIVQFMNEPSFCYDIIIVIKII